MLWEDYPDGYLFQAGDPAAGDVRLDMVLVKASDGKLIPYYCLVSHVKGDSPYSPASAEFWMAADAGVYKFLATELLLANNARIDFVSGQAIRVGDSDGMCGYFGVPVGGAIFYTGGDNLADATYVVYANGTIRCGNAQGKRITLNPTTQSLEAYGADGMPCYSLSGDDIDVNSPIPSGDSQNFTGSALSASLSIRGQDSIGGDDYQRSATYSLLTIPASSITKAGNVKVSIPSLNLTPAFHDGTTIITGVKVEYTLKVGGVYAASHYAELSRDYHSGGVTQTNQGSTAAHELSAIVRAGDSVKLEAKVTAYFYGTLTSGLEAKANTTGMVSAHLSFEGMMTRFGRNGFVVSLDSDNYFYALFGNGALRIDCKSNGSRVFKSANLS